MNTPFEPSLARECCLLHFREFCEMNKLDYQELTGNKFPKNVDDKIQAIALLNEWDYSPETIARVLDITIMTVTTFICSHNVSLQNDQEYRLKFIDRLEEFEKKTVSERFPLL